MMRRFTPATVALALVSAACSSSYQPARSPRISVIQEGGSPTLVRDGQSFSVGLFGGGIEEAVRGNAAAEEHATSYKTLSIAGWSVYVAGIGSSVAGLYLLADNKVGGSDNDTAGATLALSGVAALVTSLVLIASAQPHLWDAVNIYNDGVDASLAYPMQPPPGLVRPAPPAGSAAPTAPMPAPAPAPAPSPSGAAPQ
jgi:hypothetical protein